MNAIQVRIAFVLLVAFLLASCGGNDQATLTRVISVTTTPRTVTVDQGSTTQFTATVKGFQNTSVSWSILEGSSGGTIDAQGMYNAPAKAGTFHVVATSQADPTKQSTAAVSVNSVAIAILPTIGDMEPGGSMSFAATVKGTVNRDVTWTVTEGSTAGSINPTTPSSALYIAPAMTGTYHVQVASQADTSKTAIVSVTVTSLAVIVHPSGVGLSPGATRSFTASVSGCMDDSVTWSVQEGSAGGSITSAGVYTAPNAPGEFHVIATSIAHPSIFGIVKVAVGDSGFVSAGYMMDVRTNHTATLLTNGDVLLAGGGYIGGDGYWYNTSSAEIFDHSTGEFRSTFPLNVNRDGHTATLLPDGKVLIAGGGNGGWMAYQSAELYDPSTGHFSPTGNMAARRVYHTATLLGNGKVLIVGGEDGWLTDPPNSGDVMVAELYDPATGTFSPAGRMSRVRFSHTATLLADGRVLVSGGATNWGGDITDTAEIYDPATGTFTDTHSFTGPRESHSATLLPNGNVLFTGGMHYSDSTTHEVLRYDDAYLFDPLAEQFNPLEHMNSYRSSHTSTVLPNGQVLLAGGYDDSSESPESVAEVFDPVSRTFTLIGSMTKPRAGHTATLLQDGRVLIAGGSNDETAEFYVRK